MRKKEKRERRERPVKERRNKKEESSETKKTREKVSRLTPVFGRPEGSLSPTRFCFSPSCIREKALYITREDIPYKHLSMCFLRQCEIS